MTEKNIKKIAQNTLKFTFMMIFILVFIKIFGKQNTLIGVSAYVGLSTFPYCDTGLSRKSNNLIIPILYLSAPLIAYLNSYNYILSIPLNFIYIYILMLLSIEPSIFRLNVIYMLPFLFCESVPVNSEELPIRILATFVSVVIILIYSNFKWNKLEINNRDKSIKYQIYSGLIHKRLIFRMSIGISIALFVTSLFKSEKPLWISLVVMSLTQIETDDMFIRIKQRTIGTILGTVFVAIVFGYLIPQKYQIIIVMLFGYLGFFYNDYSHKQFFNFVSSISASLIVFNQNTAMLNRFISLCIGISIVLILYFIEKNIFNKFHNSEQIRGS